MQEVMQEHRFSPGEIIFREGEDSDCAYQILAGKVDIYKHESRGTILLAELGEGEVFGEMGIISNQPRSAYASAKGDVTVKIITRESLAVLMGQQPEVVRVIVNVLMERLRDTNQQLSQVINEYHGKFEISHPDAIPPVNKVTLIPLSDQLKALMPANGIVIQSFPFRVGATPPGVPPNPLDWNNLFVSGADPEIMSRNHFAIQRGEKGLVVSDRGSKTGTIVNGMTLGSGSPEFKVAINPGENELIAGPQGSPYRFTLLWQ